MQKCKEFFKKHIELVLAAAKLFAFVDVILISFGLILGIATAKTDYMQPNIKYHDNIIYSRLSDNYILRDVVVYNYDATEYIGRVVGMPGDTIKTNSSGNIFQNGHLVYEDNIKYTLDRSVDVEVEITLGEDQYFIICDDRSQNFDSRTFGAINSSDIKGKVLIVLRRYDI